MSQATAVHVLVFDGFADWEPAQALAELRSDSGRRVVSVSFSPDIVCSMGGLRVVNSDLIVRPYLTQEINVSTYCLGARLIAEFEAERMGIGMPFNTFKEIVQGLEDSKGGFPFPMYPGATAGATAS